MAWRQRGAGIEMARAGEQSVYFVEIARGYGGVFRRGVGAAGRPISGGGYAGPGSGRMSRQSRARLNRTVLSLDLGMLGDRPAMITLTEPGRDWEVWCPSMREFERQRRAFVKRYERRFGPMKAVWVKEAQRRGAPHLHFLTGLPDDLEPELYRQLQERTTLVSALQMKHGTYRGRAMAPPVGFGARSGSNYGGWYGMWLRRAWSEIVTGGQDSDHYVRGVDIRVCFFNDEASVSISRVRLADYLRREMGKWHQKQFPEWFVAGGNPRYWGLEGREVGFEPRSDIEQVDELVAVELRSRLRRWIVLRARASGATSPAFLRSANLWDGLTAYGLERGKMERMFEASRRAADRRGARRLEGVAA